MNTQKSSLNAPQPHKTISCQQLLLEDFSHSGWLRKRSKIHKSIKLVVKIIPWMNKYSVLSKGCMYVFDSDSSKKPSGAFTLHGYNSVMRAGEVVHSEAPWAFKLMSVDKSEDRVRFFSASSEREQKKWMQEIKKQMMFANGQGCRISHKRQMSRSSSREDGDQSATYSDIEDDVYQRNSDIRLGNIDDIDSDDDEPRDYNEIDDWTGDESTGRSPTDSRRNMPLPLPPKQDASAPVVRPRDTHVTKSKSDVGPELTKRPIIPTPNSKTHNKKPPELPLQLPEEDVFDDEPRTPKAIATLPSLTSPTRTDNTPQRNHSSATAGIVSAMKQQFDNKPVIAPRPGAQKVLPTLPRKPKNDVTDSPSALPKKDGLDKPPTPEARFRPLPKPPGIRSEPGGTDNPEQDYLEDIFWHGDKDEANTVLTDIGEDGVYLIRGSEHSEQVLVVYAEGGARKYKIVQSLREVYIASDCTFSTMQEMLDYYHTNELPRRRTMLTRPYNR